MHPAVRDVEPPWLDELRAEWDDRLAACETLVAAGQMTPERLELDRTQAAWELAHPEQGGVLVGGRELTREELHDPADVGPRAGPVERLPVEEERDLEELKALAERRKTHQSQLMESWNRLPEYTKRLVDAAGAVTAPQAETRFDRELAANIARREREVWTLRLRGLLRVSPRRTRETVRVRPVCRPSRFGRSPRRAARARSCARTPARPQPERVARGRR